MARGLRDIKRQIKSVQNRKADREAMEMVAAAKLRRAQEKATSHFHTPRAERSGWRRHCWNQGISHPMLESVKCEKPVIW